MVPNRNEIILAMAGMWGLLQVLARAADKISTNRHLLHLSP
jgi:hypothetical protein